MSMIPSTIRPKVTLVRESRATTIATGLLHLEAGEVVRLLSNDLLRQKVKIRNVSGGGVSIYIGGSRNDLDAAPGWVIKDDEKDEFAITGDIWIRCGVGGPGRVRWLVETGNDPYGG